MAPPPLVRNLVLPKSNLDVFDCVYLNDGSPTLFESNVFLINERGALIEQIAPPL